MDSVKNKILIVEDSELHLAFLTSVLCEEYELKVAKDGLSAVAKAKEFLPDLILLDIILPEMNGYEVISVLKSSDETRDIPIIFITGLNSADSEKKGLSLGAVDFISKPFDPVIVRLRVCNQIKICNQLRLIELLSTTDQLTGLPNRRSFDARIEMEWNRAKREKTLCGLLLTDIDNFKIYNDTYGHLNGDIALKAVADILKSTPHRPSDYSARWGGEEFIVLLPATDIDGALNVAESIRESIERKVIQISDNKNTGVTVSIGVNTHLPEINDSIDDFFSGADKALYLAKRTGKNKVCMYDDNRQY